MGIFENFRKLFEAAGRSERVFEQVRGFSEVIPIRREETIGGNL